MHGVIPPLNIVSSWCGAQAQGQLQIVAFILNELNPVHTLKTSFNKMVWTHLAQDGLGGSDSPFELSSSIKDRELLDYLSDYQLRMEDSAPWV
jgi:hypothetical protein